MRVSAGPELTMLICTIHELDYFGIPFVRPYVNERKTLHEEKLKKIGEQNHRTKKKKFAFKFHEVGYLILKNDQTEKVGGLGI